MEQTDIGFVRRELDDLADVRCLYGWDDRDRDRYKELCELERFLLQPSS